VSVLRFYVRHADGSITDDETCLIETPVVSQLEKGFDVLGERGMNFVIEFDPPLVVPPPAKEAFGR
jgi:hypothetical protein